jgi:hypothetical protein
MTPTRPNDDREPQHAGGQRRDGQDEAVAVDEPPLDTRLRRQRASLRSAMGRIEDAVAAPVRGDPGPWLRRVVAETAVLRDYFTEHLEGTEGPHGYYAGLLAEAPRLAGAIRRLIAEHRRMATVFSQVDALEEQARDDRQAVDELREKVVALLVLFSRHRQHGSDLLWEAYGFDVGGEA